MTLEIALDTTITRIARDRVYDMTPDQLDGEGELRRVEIGSLEYFEYVEDGMHHEKSGEGIELNCWVHVDDGDVTVVACRTDGSEHVFVDCDVERAVLESLAPDRAGA